MKFIIENVRFIVGCLLLLLATFSYALDSSHLAKLQKQFAVNTVQSAAQNEWIIGQSDPNEIVEITQAFRYDGDITVVNNGQLIVRDTDFTLNGNLIIWQNGQVRMTHSNVFIEQEYIYEHDAVVLMNGTLELNDVNFQSSGQSWSIGLTGEASYTLVNSTITNGFITTAAFEQARIFVDGTETPGEFLCFGDNDASFSNSDFLLFWIVTPDSSQLDMSLPDDSLLVDWQFPQNNGTSGIPYTVKIDSCTQVMWGLISQSGSDAVFRDTRFRVAGLYFQTPDSLTVNNLTNGSTHSDEWILTKDRSLRFINTKVDIWNFYTAKEARLAIDNCIFGEVLSMDSSRVDVLNSVCDGSGGYIGAMDKSFMLILGSLVKSQVIARKNSIFVCAHSAILGSEIDADEQAVMFIANTTYTADPQAHQAAVIFEAQLPPVDASVDEIVPLTGTARLIAGPDNPIEFSGYQVDYKEKDGQWRPTDGRHDAPVFNDHLADWNTYGLATGSYDVRLSLYHSYGDSISMDSYACLSFNTIVKNVPMPKTTRLLHNVPNPFNPTTTINYELAATAHVRLIIYNSIGQIVQTQVDEVQAAGQHAVHVDASNWPAGSYFYRLQTDDVTDVKRMLLVK